MTALRHPSTPWNLQLQRSIKRAENLPPPPVEGQLSRMIGLPLEAVGCQAAIGDC
jgi:hypothetical protein